MKNNNFLESIGSVVSSIEFMTLLLQYLTARSQTKLSSIIIIAFRETLLLRQFTDRSQRQIAVRETMRCYQQLKVSWNDTAATVYSS